MGIESLSVGALRRSPLWRKRWVQGAVVVLAIVGAGTYYMGHRNVAKPVNYRFGTVERGTITTAVSASGTLSAVGAVNINSPLTGQVVEVLADYNQTVTAGQILARLDPESFDAKLRQAKAELAISRASLQSAQASVERAQSDIRNGEASLQSLKAQQVNAQAAYDTAQKDFERQKDLFTRNVVTAVAVQDSQTKLNSAKSQIDQITANISAQSATMDGRKAALSIAMAGVTTARATIQQKEAAVSEAQVDLDRTSIRAPGNGMVIAKNAEVGQSVNANQTNAQSALFTIARDLRSMEINVSVDEADIGKVQDGMNVSFTVDGYPGREFTARVTQVRLQPKTVQNVVTYTVVASADNADLALLPGMTATAKIVIDQRAAALRVPNGALRYAPIGFTAAPATGGGAPAGGAPPGALAAGGGAGGFPGGGAGGAGGFARGGNGGNGGNGGQPAAGAAAGAAPAGAAPPGGNAPQAAAPANGGRGAGGANAPAAANANTPAGANAPAAATAPAATPGAAGNGQAAAGNPKGGAGGNGGRGQALANLTPEQAAQVQQALAARAGGGGQAAAAGGGTPRPVQAVRTRSARVFVLNAAGQPEPVTVTIGITDGGFTEVVAGLTEGQKVIIGSDQVANYAASRPAGGPGGFFGF